MLSSARTLAVRSLKQVPSELQSSKHCTATKQPPFSFAHAITQYCQILLDVVCQRTAY